MNKHLIIISFLLWYGCKGSKDGIEQEAAFFEGQIDYSIDYKVGSDSDAINLLKESMGSKMTMIFKEGNHVKRYYNPLGNLVKTVALDLNVGRSYYQKSNSDTIFWFDITHHDSKSEILKIEDGQWTG